MNKFIRLTNAAKEHKGNTLVLNTRYIVSVFEGKDANDDPVTVIYGALKDGWNVEESVEVVIDLIGDAS